MRNGMEYLTERVPERVPEPGYPERYEKKPAPQRWIQRVPYQRKVVEYEEYEYQEEVPVEVKRIEYDQVKRVEYVPVERVVTDYYAVQVTKAIIPQIKPTVRKEIVPVQKNVQKVVYRPVETAIVHKPQESLQPGSPESALRGSRMLRAYDFEQALRRIDVTGVTTKEVLRRQLHTALQSGFDEQTFNTIWTNTSSSQRAEAADIAAQMEQMAATDYRAASMLVQLINLRKK